MIDLVAYNRAQCKEINDYIWGLGVQLGHDPTQDKPRELLEMEWVTQYAMVFAVNNRAKFEINISTTSNK